MSLVGFGLGLHSLGSPGTWALLWKRVPVHVDSDVLYDGLSWAFDLQGLGCFFNYPENPIPLNKGIYLKS